MLLFRSEYLRILQSAFQPVKTGDQFPVLKNLLVTWEAAGTEVVFTKSNLETVIKKSIPINNPQMVAGSMLVTEKILWDFINFTSEEIVSIEIDKLFRVLIKAGKSKISSTTEEAEHFPSTPNVNRDEAKVINLEYCRLVANLVNSEEIYASHPSGYVFLGKNGTCGGDGIVMFQQKSATHEDEVCLRPHIIAALPNEELRYASSENYHFFFTEKTEWAFVKTEMKWMSFDKFFDVDYDGGFTVDKVALLKFNNLAVSAALQNARDVTASWVSSKEQDTIELSMQDEAYNIDITDQIRTTGEVFDFAFFPLSLSKLLKAIPYETLQIKNVEGKAYFTTVDGSHALMAPFKKVKHEPDTTVIPGVQVDEEID